MEFKSLLSSEEHQKWVEEQVIPTFTKGVRPSAQPTFVLVTGQSGAGKSYSSKKYAESCLLEKPVVFATDDIRILHPMAVEIMRADPLNYPFLTKKDAGMARTALLNHCFDNKYNVVIESILLSADDYKMQTLKDARDHGYKIECVALGVHRHVSEVSIFARQEEQIRINNGLGFPATPDEHDKSYELLPEILSNMQKYGTVDRIGIYTRAFECFYDSDTDEHNALAIRESMVRARNSALNSDTMTDVFLKWRDVLESMKARHAPEKEIERADNRFKGFTKQAGLLLSSEFRLFTNGNIERN